MSLKKPKPEQEESDDEDPIIPDLSITIGDLKICSRDRSLKSVSAIMKKLLEDKQIKTYLRQRNEIKLLSNLGNIPDYCS